MKTGGFQKYLAGSTAVLVLVAAWSGCNGKSRTGNYGGEGGEDQTDAGPELPTAEGDSDSEAGDSEPCPLMVWSDGTCSDEWCSQAQCLQEPPTDDPCMGPCFDGVCYPKASNEPCNMDDPCFSEHKCLPCGQVPSLSHDECPWSGKVCISDKPMDCDDLNPCTEDTPVVQLGECVCSHAALPDFTICDDGKGMCSKAPVCMDGVCKGEPISDEELDDTNPCTQDFCMGTKGIVHKPVDDGLVCTSTNKCVLDAKCLLGACVGVEKGCPATECAVGMCDPATGACEPAPINEGGPCNAGPCAKEGVCKSGECCPVADKCDDGNPCTSDVCDHATGECEYFANDGAACDDGNACSAGDVCAWGVCSGQALSPDMTPCDTGNPAVEACFFGECLDVCQKKQCGEWLGADCGGCDPGIDECNLKGFCVGVQVLVPPGQYLIGCPPGASCKDIDYVQFPVELGPFMMDKYPVTACQFAWYLRDHGLLDDEGRQVYDCDDAQAQIDCQNDYAVAFEDCWRPVVEVSWYGARDYAKWAGRELPSEIFLRAAFGGSLGTLYPWGNSWMQPPACNCANVDPLCQDNWMGLSPVNAFPQGCSASGACDSGNVREFAANWFECYCGTKKQTGAIFWCDPKCGLDLPFTDVFGPCNAADECPGYTKVALFGGSYQDISNVHTNAYRDYVSPSVTDSSIGFRCYSQL